MKGAFPEEIVWTAVVLLTIIIIAVIGILALVLAFGFSGRSSLSSTIDFVVQTNKPYALATALTYYKSEDRNFLEHAVEISYSTVENASSQNLANDVAVFLDKYDLSFYNVRITKGEKTVQADISGRLAAPRCGDNLEGFCVNVADEFEYQYNSGPCGVGRIEIQGGANACPRVIGLGNPVCCALKIEDFRSKGTGLEVRTCGVQKEGICNALKKKKFPDEHDIITESPYCAEGIADGSGANDCRGFNSDRTPTCCLYGDAAVQREQEIKRLTSASIPLLYKDGFGYAEVTIG